MQTPLVDNFVPARPGDRSDDLAGIVTANFHSAPKRYALYNRPYIAEGGPNDGMACVTVNVMQADGTPRFTVEKGVKHPVLEQHRVVDRLLAGDPNVPMWALNATSFRRDDWRQLDDEVVAAYLPRLKLVRTLQQNVQVGGFNGWGKLTYEYDVMSAAHEAVVDMDGLTEGRNDAPLFLPRSAPLPFTHSDFFYSDRLLAASRSNGGTGLDVYSGAQASERVAEKVEDVAIGLSAGITYGTRTGYFAHDGTSTQYGMLTYVNRNTKTNFTVPTTGGWVANTAYNEILAALETLFADNVYGPFAIFHSTEWTPYMNGVFSITGGNNPGETLRTMLLKNPDITAVERLDRLTGLTGGNVYTILIVALNRRYVRFINGMDLTTWQWDTRGGHQKNFKVGVVQTTVFLADYVGKSGILHGTTA